MYISGLHTGGMLHFNGKRLHMSVELPSGAHNAQPFRDGVLFNDSQADALRYAGRGEGSEDRAMQVPHYDSATLDFPDEDDTGVARPGFARGLCVLSNTLVDGDEPPATKVFDKTHSPRAKPGLATPVSSSSGKSSVAES